MQRITISALVLLSILGVALVGSALGEDKSTTLLASGFEKEFDTLPGVTHSKADSADRWMRDNYGDNITRFIRDTRDPHSGQSCLKMSCLRYDTGAAATLSPRFHVERGKKYVLRLWLKARSLPKGRSVFVRVRNAAVQDATPASGENPPAKWSTHAKRRCSVSDEWQEFTLDVEPEYDADVEIQLGYESVGTLWVDDVSVSEGSVGSLWQPAPPSDEPPRKGNLIYNGSFEVGPSGWGRLKMEPLDRYYGGRHIDATIEKTGDAPNGEYALRVDSTEWIESEYIHVRPGQNITVSAYFKAEKEPMPVQLSFLDGTMVKYCEHPKYSTSCNVTTKWQRFSVSGRLPASADNGIVVRIWGSRGVFLADAVQVEEGDISPFNIGADLEVGTEKIGTDTGIYRPGETSRVRVFAHGKPGATVDVESRLEDYYGATRQTRHSQVKLDSKGDGSAEVDIALPAPGIYRLVSDAKGTRRPAEIIMAQVKKAAAPYGGVHAMVTRFSLDFVKDMGFGWWRLHDHANPVRWNRVEPEKGKLVFDDEAVNKRLSTGVKILGCLYDPPSWAQGRNPKDPGSITLPHFGTFNIDEWKNYVRETVRHYKDRIHHWQIWNEPGKGWGSYFRLLKETYPVIKEEDPDAFVVDGGLHHVSSPDLEKFLDVGALDYMDAHDWHGYPQEGRDPWTYGAGITELMKKHGKVVPFWDSEWGVQCYTFRRASYYGGQSTYRWMPMPYRTAVNMVLRHEISERAVGVEANFWYTMNRYYPIRDNSGGLMTLAEYDGSPRATVPALANSWDLLGQAELVEILSPSDVARIYTFKRPDGALWVVDTKMLQGMSAEVILPVNRKGVRINAMGERSPLRPTGGKLVLPVCDEPVFVLFEGVAPEEIAAAAKAAKFQDMPPAGLLALLAIDRRNQTPELLKDARYAGEVKLGFGLNGWLFANGKGKILVFAGDGPAAGSTEVSVFDPRIKVYNSLGDDLPVKDRRISIANRAPYFAVGGHPEKSVRSAGRGGAANLLKNPSFEQGENGKTPADWNEWKRFGGKSTFVKAEGGRTPESTGLAVVIQSPKEEFVMAEQWVQRPLKKGERYGLSVWLKADRPVRADVFLSSRAHDKTGKYLGATESRSRHSITTSWAKYSTSIVMKAGEGSDKDGLVAVVQLFEDPNTKVEMDDAELVFLGTAE